MAAAEFTDRERGETLLELVVAIVILGVCVVAIGGTLAASVKMSEVHREQAIAQQFLHNYAESVQAGAYDACSAGHTPNYRGGLAAPTDGGSWTILQPSVTYWTGAAFVAACPAAGDPGLQQVRLELKSSGGFVDETLDFVMRRTT